MKQLRLTEEELAALTRRHGARIVRNGLGAEANRPKRPSAPAPKAKADPGRYSRSLARQLKILEAPAPILEYAFDRQLDGSGRGWSFDLAWPALRFAVEVDGAVHRIKARYKADIEKHQRADALGWRVLRVTPHQVETGAAADLVQSALSSRTD